MRARHLQWRCARGKTGYDRDDAKLVWKPIDASLEDVFIGLMAQAKDNVS